MFTIYLENLTFTALHGVHDEEKLCAGQFEVNVEITLTDTENPIIELDQTVDYSVVFECIKKNMNAPTALLETLIQQIETDLHNIYPNIQSLAIKIQKKNPPIIGIQGKVGVGYKKIYTILNS